MNISIIGAGAWGTALGKVLAENGHAITLWSNRPGDLEELGQKRTLEKYLPGIKVPPCAVEPNLESAIKDAECVVVAVTSNAFRSVSSALADYRGLVISVTKGIEFNSGLTMSGVLTQTAPRARVAALSGPTFALEVAKGIPTAIVAGSSDPEAAATAQQLFHRPAFRVYTNTDILGVELGGALKNVVAIAAGVGDGLGFGDNSKAALITRGIVEIRRLGVARGAHPETFSGLSGLGDLSATCFSKLSRNRGFGERVGRGEAIDHVIATSLSVPEGYPTARSAYQLARTLDVATPIIDETFAMLYQGKSPRQAVQDLTNRESKAEYW